MHMDKQPEKEDGLSTSEASFIFNGIQTCPWERPPLKSSGNNFACRDNGRLWPQDGSNEKGGKYAIAKLCDDA